MVVMNAEINFLYHIAYKLRFYSILETIKTGLERIKSFNSGLIMMLNRPAKMPKDHHLNLVL